MRVAMLVSNGFRTDARSIKSAASLVKYGLEVLVYAWDRDGSGAPDGRGATVQALGPRSTYGRGLFQLPAYLMYMMRVLGLLLRDPPDVIHCHRLDCLCVGAVAAILRRRRLIYDAHMPFADRLMAHASQPGMRTASAMARRIEGWLLRHVVDWTFVDGPLYARQLAPGARGPVDVLLNVPEREFGGPWPAPVRRSGFCFGRVGLICEQVGQGAEPLASVLRRFQRERPELSARLMLVGPIVPTVYKAKIEAELAPLGRQATVADSVPRSEVGDVYRQLDVSVVYYAPESNGFGALGSQQKVFESMAHGVPLVILSNAFMNQVVAEAGCGLVLSHGGVEDLFAALERLADDPEERLKMGELGRRHFEERYNWENEEQRLWHAYSQG